VGYFSPLGIDVDDGRQRLSSLPNFRGYEAPEEDSFVIISKPAGLPAPAHSIQIYISHSSVLCLYVIPLEPPMCLRVCPQKVALYMILNAV